MDHQSLTETGFSKARKLRDTPPTQQDRGIRDRRHHWRGRLRTVYRALDIRCSARSHSRISPGGSDYAQGLSVVVRSRRHAESYASGLNGFINEARTLARFDHRALVRVFRVCRRTIRRTWRWRCARGAPLTRVVKSNRKRFTEAWLKAMLIPLLEAVETLHDERIYHRDIAPDKRRDSGKRGSDTARLRRRPAHRADRTRR